MMAFFTPSPRRRRTPWTASSCKHRASIAGVLSCFDRVLFKGHLPIGHGAGLDAFLTGIGLKLKEFKHFAVAVADDLKSHARGLAEEAGREYRYLPGVVRKEQRAESTTRCPSALTMIRDGDPPWRSPRIPPRPAAGRRAELTALFWAGAATRRRASAWRSVGAGLGDRREGLAAGRRWGRTARP